MFYMIPTSWTFLTRLRPAHISMACYPIHSPFAITSKVGIFDWASITNQNNKIKKEIRYGGLVCI